MIYIPYNTTMKLFNEFKDIYHPTCDYHMFNLYLDEFNQWLDNNYGFQFDLNTTNFVVTNQQKKLLFDMKYPQ